MLKVKVKLINSVCCCLYESCISRIKFRSMSTTIDRVDLSGESVFLFPIYIYRYLVVFLIFFLEYNYATDEQCNPFFSSHCYVKGMISNWIKKLNFVYLCL